MNEILNQLGGLVLGAVPTMVLMLLLVVSYGLLVRRPMERVLNQRRARTTGAVEEAQKAIAQAETRTAAYEDKLRKARAEILASREQKLKQWSVERDQALAGARAATVEKVKAAKGEIEQSVAIARLQIDGTSAELSEQVLRAVMPPGTRPEAAQ
jgi:F-type H+-transporting ATPase subunit b